MYKIIDGLYQGPAPENAVDVDVVFNLMLPSECERHPKPNDFNPKAYYMLSIEDGPNPGMEWLKQAVESVITELDNNNSVLIHCRGGISRSAMLTAAVLIKKNNWNTDKALNYIAEKNPTIDPALQFIKLLNLFCIEK